MDKNVSDIPEYKYFERGETRAQIAAKKTGEAVKFPVSLACIHLFSDGNLGFIIRAAACFGASEVLVIGALPSYRDLRQYSCGTNNLIDIKVFSNTREFMHYCRSNDIHIVSLELCDKAVDITKYTFPKDKKVCIITGNESAGVPGDIIHNSDCIFIPNPGIAPCMNTSQAANVALYEYVRQVYTK